MNGNLIKNISINNLWNEYNIRWEELNPDINILVGINGSFKSTLLRILSAVLARDFKSLEKYGKELSVCIEFDNEEYIRWENQVFIFNGNQLSDSGNSAYLSTFDTPIRDKDRLKKNESSLDQELDSLIYQRDKNNPINFTNYRLKATMPKYNSQEIAENIQVFFAEIINPLFSKTGKTIEIDDTTNDLIFRKKDQVIRLTELSSGEKQILIILFRLFLMEKKRYIVLMDEPEISLHIEWQHRLIDTMLAVNPNCQYIISTHSPSIFGKGWMDKLQQIDKLKI